VNQRLSVTRQ